jgi:hypothetical protein
MEIHTAHHPLSFRLVNAFTPMIGLCLAEELIIEMISEQNKSIQSQHILLESLANSDFVQALLSLFLPALLFAGRRLNCEKSVVFCLISVRKLIFEVDVFLLTLCVERF